MNDAPALVADEELERKVRRYFDLVEASRHGVPTGVTIVELTAHLAARSTSSEYAAGQGAQALGRVVASHLALAPYRQTPSTDRAVGLALADELLATDGLPEWLPDGRVAKDIGLAYRARTAEERDRLVRVARERLEQSFAAAAEADLDFAAVEQRLRTQREPLVAAAFMSGLRVSIAFLEREARGEALPQWAIDAVRGAGPTS